MVEYDEAITMALELPIAVYGNGDLYRELFNAIAAALSDSSYSYLIKLSICLTGTWAIIRYSVERSLMPLAKWLMTYYVAFYIVFMPKVTVEILDQVNLGKAYTVDNVPLGLAAVANLTTAIGSGLTALTEKTFSLPDDMKYAQTGMVMASRLVLATTQFQITDPNFQQSMQGFVHQCVFYDLLLNKYSWSDLLNATQIWSFIGNYASPARAFAYYQPGNTKIVTCKDGYTMLTRDWQNAIQDAAARYGSRLFPDANDAKAQLLSYLPDSYNFLANISDQAANIMQQNMMANALQNGILQMGSSTNAPAALEAYAFTKAQQQKRLTNYTIGDMAAYWLPIMKNVLEATLYGSFIFVFLLILFPFGKSIFNNYIASLMWIQLWAPLYAILNLFMSFYAQKHSLGALNLGNGSTGLSLTTQSGLAQVNADVAGLAGYLSLSVPLLAAGIVKGLMSVFTQAAQYIAGVTQSAGANAAGEAVAGNFSLGNTNFSNHSAFNTSANHFDTNARVTSGMYSSQMPGGSSVSMAPDGSLIMNNQPAISSLATSFHISDTVRETAMRQAEVSETAAINYGHSYATSLSSALRGLYDLANSQGFTSASGENSSLSQSSSTQEAVGNVKRLTEQFAGTHQISYGEASQLLRSAYLDTHATAGINSSKQILGMAAQLATGASASVSGTAGIKGSWDHTSSENASDLYSAAQNFVHDSSYSQNVDTALRGVSEQHYRTGSEEGQRLVDGISSSYEQSVQVRNDMQSSLNQAQSYRDAATYAQEHSDSINTNGGQVLFEQMQQATHGNLRDIESTEVNHPMDAQSMGNQLSQQYANDFLNDWRKSHQVNTEGVEQANQQNNATLAQANQINQANATNHASVEVQAHEKGLGEGSIVDKSAKTATETLRNQSQKQINAAQSSIKAGERSAIKDVNEHDIKP